MYPENHKEKRKNCKIPILPQYEYPMPYRTQFF